MPAVWFMSSQPYLSTSAPITFFTLAEVLFVSPVVPRESPTSPIAPTIFLLTEASTFHSITDPMRFLALFNYIFSYNDPSLNVSIPQSTILNHVSLCSSIIMYYPFPSVSIFLLPKQVLAMFRESS